MARRTYGGLASWCVMFACVVGVGCRQKDHEVPPPPVAPTAKPVDHLAPNELLEGTTKVLDLPLPRVARVDRRLGNTVYVNAPTKLEELASYVESHVEGAKITHWKEEVIFEHAKVKGTSRVLDVSVYPRRDGQAGTSLAIFDATPKPDPFTTEADRYKSVGLRPDGKLLDPTTLE